MQNKELIKISPSFNENSSDNNLPLFVNESQLPLPQPKDSGSSDANLFHMDKQSAKLFDLINQRATIKDIEAAINNGADLNTFDSQLRDPLELAQELGLEEISTYLKNHPHYKMIESNVNEIVALLKSKNTNQVHSNQHDNAHPENKLDTPPCAPPLFIPFQGPYATMDPAAPREKTTLHKLVAKKGTAKNIEAIRTLISTPEGEAMINRPNFHYITPLGRAIRSNNPQAIELLLMNGACPYHVNQHGNQRFSLGISRPEEETLIKLFEVSNGYFAFERDKDENHTLHDTMFSFLIQNKHPLAKKAIELIPLYCQSLKAELKICMDLAFSCFNTDCMETIMNVANQYKCEFNSKDWQDIIFRNTKNLNSHRPRDFFKSWYWISFHTFDRLTSAFKHLEKTHQIDLSPLAKDIIKVAVLHQDGHHGRYVDANKDFRFSAYPSEAFSNLLFWLKIDPLALDSFDNSREYLLFSVIHYFTRKEQLEEIQKIFPYQFGKNRIPIFDGLRKPQTIIDYCCKNQQFPKELLISFAKDYPEFINEENYHYLIINQRFDIINVFLKINPNSIKKLKLLQPPGDDFNFITRSIPSDPKEFNDYLSFIDLLGTGPCRNQLQNYHHDYGNMLHLLFYQHTNNVINQNRLIKLYQRFKKYGVPLEQLDGEQRSILHLMSIQHRHRFHENLFSLMIDDFNANQLGFIFGLRDNEGNSVLHNLAGQGHCNAIRMFLNKAHHETVSLHATNNRGLTVMDYAVECNQHETVQMLHQQYQIPLPENYNLRANQAEINYGQSVHNAAVEKSASQSAKRLYQRFICPSDYQNKFNKWIESLEAQKAECHLDDKFSIAKSKHLDKIIADAKEINEKFMKQDMGSAKTQCISWLKAQNPNDHRVAVIQGQIAQFESNTYCDTGSSVTSRQALGLVWLAIHDPMAQINENVHIMVEDLTERRQTLIQYFYEICRGYNLDSKGRDNGGKDSRICSRGAFTQYIASLNGSHQDVELRFVNTDSIKAKLDRIILELFHSLPENEKNDYSKNWDDNNGMPDSFLNRFKNDIHSKIYAHFGLSADCSSDEKLLVDQNLDLLDMIVPQGVRLYRLKTPQPQPLLAHYNQVVNAKDVSQNTENEDQDPNWKRTAIPQTP